LISNTKCVCIHCKYVN